MSRYCGIDLHSNNHVVVVIDEKDKRVFDKRLDNDLSMTLEVLSPYRETLKGLAVESTFNWYWLIDGLCVTCYTPFTINTWCVKSYAPYFAHLFDQLSNRLSESRPTRFCVRPESQVNFRLWVLPMGNPRPAAHNQLSTSNAVF